MWSQFMFSVGGDTMMIAPWMVLLLVITLHLQFHHTKYLLVNVDSGNKPVSRNSKKPISRISNTPVSRNSNKPISRNSNKPISRKRNKPISKKSNKPISKNSNKPVSRNSNKAMDWDYLTEDNRMSMLRAYAAIIF